MSIFFVESERDVGGRGGVRHHALHLEELLTCDTTGNHRAAAKMIVVKISLKTLDHDLFAKTSRRMFVHLKFDL